MSSHRHLVGWWTVLLLSVGTVGLLFPTEVGAIKCKRPAEARDYPEVVLIEAFNPEAKDPKQRKAYCSGVLIDSNVVLTAAHCAQGFESWQVQAPYARGGAVRTRTKLARIHPDYQAGRLIRRFDNRVFDHDLALLILEIEIEIGRKFPQLYQGDLLPLETKVMVVGRKNNGKLSLDKLYKSDELNIAADDRSTNVYGANPNVIEQGDSGGPVYSTDRNQKIVAVVGGKIQEYGEMVPTNVFAPLYKKNKDWIAEVLEVAKRERQKKKK